MAAARPLNPEPAPGRASVQRAPVVFGEDPAALEPAITTLEVSGIEPAAAFDGEHGQHLLETYLPSMVIVDLGPGAAPARAALEFLSAARRRLAASGSSAPVVLLASSTLLAQPDMTAAAGIQIVSRSDQAAVIAAVSGAREGSMPAAQAAALPAGDHLPGARRSQRVAPALLAALAAVILGAVAWVALWRDLAPSLAPPQTTSPPHVATLAVQPTVTAGATPVATETASVAAGTTAAAEPGPDATVEVAARATAAEDATPVAGVATATAQAFGSERATVVAGSPSGARLPQMGSR